ncbi:two-component response regulator ORR5 [Artemisia annua]|uniref:Two-component response regulator ORR5 n=1 Tax=Artemisia annua TaxID=35608 RepID=A0A2U1QP67_ARTAN|nr:two-component response regulator ORR5 [Artemisia annua]
MLILPLMIVSCLSPNCNTVTYIITINYLSRPDCNTERKKHLMISINSSNIFKSKQVFNDVDLIVTDHDMKEMSGLQLLRILKKSTTRNDIPVAFMSAGDVQERIKCCKDEGAIEYFIKPLKPENVEHLINIIAEKKM